MTYLPLANLTHHKLRSVLTVLGIAIGMCMMVTLSGLTRGTLEEFGSRWEQVEADLMVTPRIGDVVYDFSVRLPDGLADKLLREHGDIVERAVPVQMHPMKCGPREYLAVGVDRQAFEAIVGGRRILKGRLFDPDGAAARWIEQVMLTPATAPAGEGEEAEPITREFLREGLAKRGGFELVVDARLARTNNLRVGETLETAGHTWTVVGIVQAGGVGRIYLPRRTAQWLFGTGDIRKSTLIFVKLRPGVDAKDAAATLTAAIQHHVQPLSQYRSAVVERSRVMMTFFDVINGVALVVAFLFIMITLYTMVLQRAREIAILKSHGASRWFIFRQVLGESVLLTAAGTAMGVIAGFPIGWAIEQSRLTLTVSITWEWVGIAVAVGAAGAVTSALYPAWRAMRVDVVETLRME